MNKNLDRIVWKEGKWCERFGAFKNWSPSGLFPLILDYLAPNKNEKHIDLCRPLFNWIMERRVDIDFVDGFMANCDWHSLQEILLKIPNPFVPCLPLSTYISGQKVIWGNKWEGKITFGHLFLPTLTYSNPLPLAQSPMDGRKKQLDGIWKVNEWNE